MMRNFIYSVFVISLFTVLACQESEKEKSHSDNEESCVNPTKDPNDVKPMALMMRTMANYCDSMRLDLKAGKVVDSIKYPLMPFWSAEPTDSSVLEKTYFDHAERFKVAYRNLMSNQENQKENYELVIQQCVQCHSSYCSGPLKRIRKLPLSYQN
jgi:thioredoxin-related protein